MGWVPARGPRQSCGLLLRFVACGVDGNLVVRCHPDGKDIELTRTYIRKLKARFVFWLVLNRFQPKVGPGTVSNGPGLGNAT